MRRRTVSRSIVPVVFSTLTACAAADEPVVEADGACADAFGSSVCSWASAQAGVPIEEGATIPLAAIEAAPNEQPMAWPPTMAASVGMPSDGAGPLDHMTMYWEPMGHAPATYLVPHFDFHFYLIPEAQRLAIDCADLTKPASLPDGYALPDEQLPPEVAEMIGVETLVGICVPEMGMHSLPAAELASSTPFESTMVVGFYEGAPIFIEPMISRVRLLRRESFDIPVPAIAGLEGRQPTTFRAEYVPDEDAYRFTFSGYGATE